MSKFKVFLFFGLFFFSALPVLAQVDTAWVRRFIGPGNSWDVATALTVDDSGNVYVTGNTATIKYLPNGDTAWVSTAYGGTDIGVDDSGNVYVTGSSGGDYATIKYSPAGDTLWVRGYNGPGNSYDNANALAVDGSGNVYVTGNSTGSGTYYDYATIKYSPNGDTLWVRRYNGPGNWYDYANALAVDDSGNVYVTGFGLSGIAADDYATIKYAPNGDTLWVRHYNGPGNSADQASALEVDSSGNVYVTGSSGGDYATIKYSPAGDTLWVRRYNGPGNSYDEATALVLDGNGNVYVTGNTATIKYLLNGDTAWVSTAYGGTDIAVDDSGSLYVTGSSWGGTSYDYTTIKYSTNGDTLWVRRYNGPGNGSDSPSALVLDNSGNVYVTGNSWGSGTLPDCVTITYSPAGDTVWVKRYNGPPPGNAWDRPNALAVDSSGNVYVTGYSGVVLEEGCLCNYATVKYAPNGETSWVRIDYSAFGEASALAVDNSGNVYVTGQSLGSGTSQDYATIKYAPNGDTLWVRRYNGPGNSYDEARALAVDGSGNVYVTGGTATIKYLQDGDTTWVRTGYYGNAIAVDDSGNVYVTGSGGIYPDFDYATIKYSPNGDTLWVKRYNGPGNGDDAATALAVDGSGNVYVTGRSGIYPDNDYATIKYAPNGDTLWVRRYNGPGNSYDNANALAVDNSGNVYVTGSSGGDYATIKYSPAGDTLWVRRYNGPGNSYDNANALAVDGIGNVYVTGRSVGSGTDWDYTTIKYAPNGDTLWVRAYNGPGNSYDEATALVLDGSGNVYVTGPSWSGTSEDYATIKYVQFACLAKPGDATGDGLIRLSDIVGIINHLYKGQPAPNPVCRADADADGNVLLPDIIYLINSIFKSGPAPVKSRECCL